MKDQFISELNAEFDFSELLSEALAEESQQAFLGEKCDLLPSFINNEEFSENDDQEWLEALTEICAEYELLPVVKKRVVYLKYQENVQDSEKSTLDQLADDFLAGFESVEEDLTGKDLDLSIETEEERDARLREEQEDIEKMKD